MRRGLTSARPSRVHFSRGCVIRVASDAAGKFGAVAGLLQLTSDVWRRDDVIRAGPRSPDGGRAAEQTHGNSLQAHAKIGWRGSRRAELISSPASSIAAPRCARWRRPPLRALAPGAPPSSSPATAPAAPPRALAVPRHAAPPPPHAPYLRRSLLQVSETWDTCVENTIRKLAYGALGGVVLSVVLFRAPPPGCLALPPPPPLQLCCPRAPPPHPPACTRADPRRAGRALRGGRARSRRGRRHGLHGLQARV